MLFYMLFYLKVIRDIGGLYVSRFHGHFAKLRPKRERFGRSEQTCLLCKDRKDRNPDATRAPENRYSDNTEGKREKMKEASK